MSGDARERLLDAALAALCEDPDAALEPERLLAAADVGEAGLVAELGGAEGLLDAVAERLGDSLVEATSRACSGDGEWPSRVGVALRALLEWLSERPGLATVAMRALPGRSRGAHRRYYDTLERFAALLAGGRDMAPAGTALPGEVEMLAVGAAEAIVLDEVAAGRASQLPAMASDILFSVLAPFLGPERAAAEAGHGTALRTSRPDQ